MLAAQSIGVAPGRMVLVHLPPNALALIIMTVTLAVPGAILAESALSFVGLGVPPPDASLGSMLQDAKAWLNTTWWMWPAPGRLISFIVLAFNFMGDGLRRRAGPDAVTVVDAGSGEADVYRRRLSRSFQASG